MNFISDNQSTVFPEIIKYLQEVNKYSLSSYGADPITNKAKIAVSNFFEKNVEIRYVSSGTASNSISLSAICPPYGGILCSDVSHLDGDECGAPEFFTGGAKLIKISTSDGIISPNQLKNKINSFGLHGIHEVKLSVLDITQISELGTVYQVDRLKELNAIAHKSNLLTHMDGARFSSACAYLNCHPSEISWKSGIDIMSLGATKNGAMACELIVIFNPKIADDIDRRQKRAGHLWSKNRYMAAQIIKWIENDRWIKAATKANNFAKQIQDILLLNKNINIPFEVEGNMVFATIPSKLQKYLLDMKVKFNKWPKEKDLTRFVASWDTKQSEISELKKILKNSNNV